MAHPAILRLARRADAGPMAGMARELIEAGLTPRYTAARLARHIADPATIALAAEDAAGLQGFALMSFDDTRAHLALLAVHPAARRQGLGRRMMDWLVTSAQVAGIESIGLELRADNATAQVFYSALGFTPTVLVPGYYEGRVNALRMVRVLRKPGTLPDTPFDFPGLRGSNP